MVLKACTECGNYKRMPPTETLCYTCRERRDNMPVEPGFCLWCHEVKGLVLTKKICYLCEQDGPEVAQKRQQAKHDELKQARETLQTNLTNSENTLTEIRSQLNQSQNKVSQQE